MARFCGSLPGALLMVLAAVAGCRRPPRPVDRDARSDAAWVPPADAGGGVVAGPPARAFLVAEAGELLHGPLAAGAIGDVRLDNGRAAFVVQAVGGEPFGFALGGGNLVDAAALPDGRDELAQAFVLLDRDFPRQAVVRELAIVVGEPGEAVVLARGSDSRDPAIAVETVYTLVPGSRALRLTTVVRNGGGAVVTGYEVGDAVEWGAADPWVGGQPGCPERDSGDRVSRLAAVGKHGSYAYLGADPGGFACDDSAAWANTVLGAFELEPGGGAGGRGVTVVRWLAVGERADTSSAVAAAMEARGDVLECVAVEALGPDDAPVSSATVRLTRGAAGPPETLVTDAAGRAVALLPRGRWRAAAEAPGRAGAGVVEVRVPVAGAVALPLTAAGRLELDVLTAEVEGGDGERAPVRVTVRGVPPTPDPEFGGRFDAGGFGRSFVLADGRGSRALPPGSYEVLVTRGPEYDLVEQAVDVAPGGSATVRGTLVRRLETPGWLGVDPHVHTWASVDSGVSGRSRVLGCAGEGVEVAIATDHNVVTDPARDVEDLGLSRWIVGLSGTEVTTDLSGEPVGHVNVFPLAVDPLRPPGAAALPWLDVGFADLVAGAGRLPGVLVQINHPRSPFNGTYALLGVGTADDAAPASLGLGGDLLEVANGLGWAGTFDAAADWARLARCGRRIVPTGGSDAHAMDDSTCGTPRTWVFAGRDRPEGATPEVLANGFRSGRVVVSTGPFVVLRVDDVPAGGMAVPRERGVLVQVRVEAAPWVDVRRVRVLQNGAEVLSLVPTARMPELVRLEVQEPLAVPGDAAIWVEVDGDAALPTLPVASPIRPWALSAPVWVDADGDGAVRMGGAACGG
ncbi:MAG: CehA/McbA family metallohydrolase [Deltaproteobacteria bacterium]|nr:CehA/McbA family metallohydrolase [Deltaproteobacteria bacterium]